MLGTRLRFILLLLCPSLLLITCGDHRRIDNGYCSVGAGTHEINSIFARWTHEFSQSGARSPVHEGRGTAVAPLSLARGICDIAPMTRLMRDDEIHRIVLERGAEPVAIPVATEGFAIVVSRDVAMQDISMAELRDLYLKPEESDTFDFVLGINTAENRTQWFRRFVLGGEKESDLVREMAGPLELVDEIASNEKMLGYAHPGETTDQVRMLSVDGITPRTAAIVSGGYPLKRTIYIHLPAPSDEVDQRTIDFVRYVLSNEAQALLQGVGLYALSNEDRIAATRTLDSYN